MLLNIDLYIQEVSSLNYLFFHFSPVKSLEKTSSLERERKITCFMFRNNVFHKNTVRCTVVVERCTLGVSKERRRSVKSGVSKVLFPDIGKIPNCFLEGPFLGLMKDSTPQNKYDSFTEIKEVWN